MKLILAFALMALNTSAFAMELVRCNSQDGKTFVGAFGKLITAKQIQYWPTDITIFRSPTELQERIQSNLSRRAQEAP